MDDRRAARIMLGILLAYVLAHLAVRLLLSPVLTIDDAREAVLGQTLDWGYQPRQPPLYNWLVWGAFRLFGVGVASLTIVKYGVLLVAYGFVYASARRVLDAPRLAILATCSLVLILPNGWMVHEGLTHSVAVFAACAVTIYALLRLQGSASLGSYLALGVALGLGMLSKFTYAVFAAGLLAAALILAPFRRRLLHRRALLTLAVAGLLVFPYALWFARQGYDPIQLYAAEVRTELGTTRVGEVAGGLYYIVRTTFYYLGPLALVFLVLFPQVYRPAAPGRAEDPDRAAAGRLLGHFLLGVIALLLIAALTSRLAYLKFRWMIPAFAPIPLYAFWRLERAGYEPGRLRLLTALLLAIELALIGGAILQVATGAFSTRPYGLNEPYDRLAEQVGAAGFRQGTIVAGPGSFAGALRLRFPDARLISLEHPYYVPPRTGNGQCLLAWEKGDLTAVPPDLQHALASTLDARLTGAEAVRVVEAPYHHTPRYTRRIAFVLLNEGIGRCR